MLVDNSIIYTAASGYHQISNISCIKSPNLNVSHLILQLSLCNILKYQVENEDVVGAAPNENEIPLINFFTGCQNDNFQLSQWQHFCQYDDISISVCSYIHAIKELDWMLNPLRAKFFGGNINIYLRFVSFLHIDATQVVEILPQMRQEPTYST